MKDFEAKTAFGGGAVGGGIERRHLRIMAGYDCVAAALGLPRRLA